MRRKFSPLTSACLLRLEEMERLVQLEGRGFERIEGSRIFTQQEVAYVLDCAPTTVANLVKAGRLKTMNIRKAVRFKEEEILRFIGAADEAA